MIDCRNVTKTARVRPDLTITNAASIGPIGALAYRFEVATNPSFSPVLVSGTVPETQRQTTFRLPSDLAFGTVYYWHVQTTDTRAGAASAFSSTGRFATIAPPVGGQASLLIDFADACPSFFAEREFTVDGQLTGSAGTWHFTAPPYFGLGPGLSLDLTQDGDRLAGTVVGSAVDRMQFPLFVSAAGAGTAPAIVSGNVRGNGEISGTLDGSLHVLHQSFGLGGFCSGADLRWTLTTGNAQPVLR